MAVPLFPQTALVWREGEMEDEFERCNGCGSCRTPGEAFVMCPIFKDSREEEASPRAHANMMRYISTGLLEDSYFADADFKRMVDHCVNCKSCQIQCPLTVNIPKLMLEARAEFVRRRGQSLSNYPYIWSEPVSRLAAMTSSIANWSLGLKPVRAVAERVVGLDKRRKMPRFAPRAFLRGARPVRPANEQARIVYFADLYANYNEPVLARQFAAIMERNGVRLEYPKGQVGSALPAMDYGSVETARRAIRRNARVFAPWINEGYRVVATEPSAALALKEEALSFVDEPLVRKLAEHAVDAMTFLRDLHAAGKLKIDFRPVPMTLGYHMPCHMRALRAGNPTLEILRLIPELKIETLGEGCCGIAGTWGMKAENFDRSMRIGARLFERLGAERIQAGLTECSTCKIQMEQGVAKTTYHPITVLAMAYGIDPGPA